MSDVNVIDEEAFKGFVMKILSNRNRNDGGQKLSKIA